VIDIYTIGFTKKNAETFFNLLTSSNVKTLIDVRLNNVSQLAGFAKRDDLKFFLKEICGIQYIHLPELAPTGNMLKSYKNGDLPWNKYEEDFYKILGKRQVEQSINPTLLDHGCLLCSEHDPSFCHRRLVINYLNANSDFELRVTHLQ